MPLPDLELNRPAYLGGGRWRLTNRLPITVVFGKNGSGKSILLRGLRDIDRRRFHYCVPERAGELVWQPNYLTEQLDGVQRANKTSSNLSNTYRQDVIARVQAYLSARGNVRGSTSPAGDPGEIEQRLDRPLPDFRFRIRNGNPPYELKRRDDSDVGANGLSSGEVQALSIALDLLLMCEMWLVEGTANTLLLVDEPDTHQHPDLQQRFAKFLVDLRRKYAASLLIATHSTTLLSALGQHGGEDVGVVYLDNSTDTQPTRPFNELHRTLLTCLGGHALMGPLFSAPLLLVEGDDDYRIWSEVPRHHRVRLAAIPCNGQEIKDYRLALERIFASLLPTGAVPSGYALLDGDKPLPVPSPSNPQDHVPFIGLNCHEAENLYLTASVLGDLDPPLTWEAAKTKINAAADQFGEKTPLLRALATQDPRFADVKPVMAQVVEILDPKNVHWTLRVGRALGKTVPQGELATFLGPQAMKAIWGISPAPLMPTPSPQLP